MNLRRREKVYAAIAKELWRRREDPEYLRQFAGRARDDAWHQVSEGDGEPAAARARTAVGSNREPAAGGTSRALLGAYPGGRAA